MYLRSLTLENFRSFPSLQVECPPSLTVVTGPNGAGKSNLLEAIASLALLRSFRATRECEIIRWGSSYARIGGEVTTGPTSLTVHLAWEMSEEGSARKIVKVNSQPIRRMADGLGKVRAVLFSPDDLAITRGEPSSRRRFLDLLLSQMTPSYYSILQRYARVREQRNSCLREGGKALDAWSQQLVDWGSRVILKRTEAVKILSPLVKDLYGKISRDNGELLLGYLPSVKMVHRDGERRSKSVTLPAGEFSSTAANPGGDPLPSLEQIQADFMHHLARMEHLERQRMATLVGPHRDDLSLLLNGREVRLYGSTGQQRAVVLAMRLAEWESLLQHTGDPPLLLLDDLFSELDEERSQGLLRSLPEPCQTFITCTRQTLGSDLHLKTWHPLPLSCLTLEGGILVSSTL